LLNVTVAGAADAAAGNDSAATAPSATTPERGRRIKSLILDSISILSVLRGRAGKYGIVLFGGKSRRIGIGYLRPRTTTLEIWAWYRPGPVGGSLVNQISR